MEETRIEKNEEIIETLEKEERIRKSKKVFKVLLWIFILLCI